MTPAQKRAKRNYWSASYQFGSVAIYAWERLDAGGRIYLLLPSSASSGKGNRAKVRLPGELTVRDLNGKEDKRRIAAVKTAVEAWYETEFRGSARREHRFTVKEVFDLVLETKGGKFADNSLRAQEVRRARRRLEAHLGSNTAWADIRQRDVRILWRSMAEAYKALAPEDRRGACGLRQTEVTIDALYVIAKWWRASDECKEKEAVLPILGWRAELKTDWLRIVGPETERAVPRHTDEEYGRLIAGITDPRRSLFQFLCRFVPLAPLSRMQRSAIAIEDDSITLNLEWTSPRRSGGTATWKSSHVLETAAGTRLRHAMEHGYLRALEAAFTNGTLDDYHVFPEQAFTLSKDNLDEVVVPACATSACGGDTLALLTVDPRIALLVDLGSEQRVGQLLRCKRSHLVLPDPALAVRGNHGYGTLKIPPSGRKHTEPIQLTSRQAAHVRDALAGYLVDQQTALRDRVHSDYLLFPSGRLRRWVAPLRPTPTSLTRTAALDAFHHFERAVGIVPQDGRGWYGVKRLVADLAADVETDPRVVRKLTGHKAPKSDMVAHYQHHQRPVDIKATRNVRERLRASLHNRLVLRQEPEPLDDEAFE